MTIVLALRYDRGVVLASDGQATTDAAGQPTRSPVRKLFDVNRRIAWGAAGSMGLQQSLRAELELLNGSAGESGQLRRRLAAVVVPVQQRAVADFVPHRGCDPPELACLFCWHDAGGPRILSIPRTGADHQFHERHAAIGSGDIFAEMTMRTIAADGSPPLTLDQAKMVAYRAIADAIDVAAVYLGPPIQMYVITADGAERVAREELDGGLADAVELWRAGQRETLGRLAG